MRNRIPIPALILVLLLGLLGSCADRHKTAPMPLMTEPVVEEPEPRDNPGSLFTPNSAEFLYDDSRAHRVGDILMVVISEVSDASQKIETTSDKTNDIDFGISAVPEGTLIREATDFLRLQPGATVGANTDHEFEGTGETTHEAEFTATVAVRVVRILPGGIMQVEGARRIRVNEETQILVVRGLVRPQDIAADNTVPSTHLAEAQIELYGEGVISDRQKPGWLSRILDNIWPF